MTPSKSYFKINQRGDVLLWKGTAFEQVSGMRKL